MSVYLVFSASTSQGSLDHSFGFLIPFRDWQAFSQPKSARFFERNWGWCCGSCFCCRRCCQRTLLMRLGYWCGSSDSCQCVIVEFVVVVGFCWEQFLFLYLLRMRCLMVDLMLYCVVKEFSLLLSSWLAAALFVVLVVSSYCVFCSSGACISWIHAVVSVLFCFMLDVLWVISFGVLRVWLSDIFDSPVGSLFFLTLKEPLVTS